MSQLRARWMALTIPALAILLTSCAGERPIPYRPQVDPRLKEKCDRPEPPPPRGKATYGNLMDYSIDAKVTMDCSDRKIDDLVKSIEGKPPEPVK